MKSLRLSLLVTFMSFVSFSYLNAQILESDCSVQPCQTTVSAMPSVADDVCKSKTESTLTSDNFLTACLKKLVNAVSISATLQNDESADVSVSECVEVSDNQEI